MSSGRKKALLVVVILGAVASIPAISYLRGREDPAKLYRKREARREGPAPTKDDAPPARDEKGFVGVLLSGEAVDVAPQFEAKLDAVNVSLGDRVERGAKVASLDARPIRRELAMARAALNAAHAQVSQARIERDQSRQQLDRRKDLSAAVSKEELESARFKLQKGKAALEMARAQVAEKQAQVQQLREKLANVVLRAPFSGYVALCYVDRGAVVRPTQPVIRLLSTEGFRVRFAVPPARSSAVAIGRKLRVAVEALRTDIPGTISHAAQEIDAAAQMIFVEGKLDVPEKLRPQIRTGLEASVFVAPGAG
jgi:RND family efflux transporter MFP subunit